MFNKVKNHQGAIFTILIALILRTIYGLCTDFAEGNTQYLQDYSQIYLIGLKFYITHVWPFWGPDITYTFSQIPGALQGLLVGLPFYLLAIPEAPFFLVNLLSTGALAFFAWYLSKRIPGIPSWFIGLWLLTAPWTLNFSTTVINPSYVLAPAILFFVGVFEILPFYKEKIVSINLSFFFLGFALGWIMQLHMSWVLLPFYILLSCWYLFRTKNFRTIAPALIFFALGFLLVISALVPTVLKYGMITGGVESTVTVNPANWKNLDVITRFLAFSTSEVRHFIPGGTEGEKSFLFHNLWAAPFAILLFFVGIIQTAFYLICFFKKTSDETFRQVKWFTLGTMLLIYISYLFAVREVASYTFYLLLPVSFWYSFYCLEPIFTRPVGRRLALLFILSGLIVHIAMAKEYFSINSLSSKRSRIVAAIKSGDSRLFAFRRVADWERAEQDKQWIINRVVQGKDTILNFLNNFDHYPPEILPESLNSVNFISPAYSCQVDSVFPFSIGLNRPWREMQYKKHVSVTVWIRNTGLNDGVLVFSATKQRKSLFWSGERICNKQELNTWKPFSISREFPATLDTSACIGVYVWLPPANRGTRIQIDDFSIGFIK